MSINVTKSKRLEYSYLDICNIDVQVVDLICSRSKLMYPMILVQLKLVLCMLIYD